jgi:hypothetical protein
MGLFTKKEKGNCIWIESHYIIDGELYKFVLNRFVYDKDRESLSNMELFDKYGFSLCKYKIEYENFRGYWFSEYYDSISHLPYDIRKYISKATEVKDEDLDSAIKKINMNFKKQFDDFKLDGTLYRANFKSENKSFSAVVKPKRKLVDSKESKLAASLILEIEVLDGKSAETKREFIPFYQFVEDYIPECGIEVFESSDIQDFKVKDYFK